MDLAISSRSDLRWAKVVIDVATRDLIPPSLWFELKQRNGFTRFIQVRYEVEGVVTDRSSSVVNNQSLIGNVGGPRLLARAPNQAPFPSFCPSPTVTGQPPLLEIRLNAP
jgi:hypothetical protein